MGWDEFGGILDCLIKTVEEYFAGQGREIHAVSPLLRSGGVVGGAMAVRMRVIPMIPVQLKHVGGPDGILQVFDIPNITVNLPRRPDILLCDTNTGGGVLAGRAAALLGEVYPGARIYLATLAKVYGTPDTIEGIADIFYGVLTDENLIASPLECERLRIRPGIPLFPWERAEDELRALNVLSCD